MGGNTPSPPGNDLETAFAVGGSGRLFDSLVATYIVATVPGSTARLEVDETLAAETTRVTVESSDRWMLISTERDPELQLAAALHKGAHAVASANAGPGEFERALHTLVNGDDIYVPAAVMRWLAATTVGGTIVAQHEEAKLTKRELEVLRLIEQGLTNHEVAERLSISTNTVRTHLHAISVKLDIPTRARLIARVRLENGETDAPGDTTSAGA